MITKHGWKELRLIEAIDAVIGFMVGLIGALL